MLHTLTEVYMLAAKCRRRCTHRSCRHGNTTLETVTRAATTSIVCLKWATIGPSARVLAIVFAWYGAVSVQLAWSRHAIMPVNSSVHVPLMQGCRLCCRAYLSAASPMLWCAFLLGGGLCASCGCCWGLWCCCGFSVVGGGGPVQQLNNLDDSPSPFLSP